jgi:DNA-binding CsgD family transcriptional regulator
MSKNTEAFLFSENISPRVEEVCQPLFTNLGLKHYGYVKIYANGLMLRLATDHNWTKKYFNYEFFNDQDFYSVDHLFSNGIYYDLVAGEPKSQHFKALYNHGVGNICIIYEKYNTFANVWFFGADKNATEILELYKNNSELLNHFNLYFKEKFIDIIKEYDAKILIKTKLEPLKNEFVEKDNISLFSEQIKCNKFYLEGKYKHLSFTPREIECLKYFSLGKSMKEIAALTNLSPRTVETYLKQMKDKIGCNSKSQLIKIFYENSNIYT